MPFGVKIDTVNLATEMLLMTGNFYINDKPTGAVVGLQPLVEPEHLEPTTKLVDLNLVRWTSQRTIKETFNAPTDFVYEYMK